ncbi:MAG: hypothetical protein AAB443_01930 [Patescibacteria group bacterium]
MTIAFCFNVKQSTPSLSPKSQQDIEFDSRYVINSIVGIIEQLGHKVLKIEADERAFAKLRKARKKIDLVFNIAEGIKGDARESQIPLFCEMLGIPYTHSSPTTHAITLNKYYTKLILKAKGVTTPECFLIKNLKFSIPPGILFPLIAKPNCEGSSKWIFDKNVVENNGQLRRRAKELITKGVRELLVEEFIDGREFTVGSVGDQILPIIEQRFDFLPIGFKKIAGYELKWLYEDSLKRLEDAYYCPAKISKKMEEEIYQTCLVINSQLNIKDASRIDFRLGKNGKLYFLEVNSLPGMNPNEKEISYLPLAWRVKGGTYQSLIAEIIKSALERYKFQK